MGSLDVLLKICFENLFARKKFYSFLFVNLFIGLFGFFTVQVFQSSLAQELKNKAQSTLGGDFSIVASQKLSDQQINEFEKNLIFKQKTSVIEFFAMIQVNDRNRLVTVKAYSENYPLYGKIGSENSAIATTDEKLWLDPELIQFLKLPENLKKINEWDRSDQPTELPKINLGELQFNQFEAITVDTSRFLRGTGFAPTLYVPFRLIEKSGLIQTGSTLRNYLIYSTTSKETILESEKNFYSQVKDPTIRFETAEKKSESNNTAFKYFTDYLGLVSIISMALCFLAIRYLLNWIFNQDRINIGIYKTLGLSNAKTQFISLFPMIVISLISYIFSAGLIYVLNPVFNRILSSLDIPLILHFNVNTLLLVLVIAVVAPLVMFIPTGFAIQQLSPKLLLHNSYQELNRKKMLMWFLLVTFLFWMLSFYQSKSYKVATLFSFGLIAIILVIYALVFGLSFVLKKYTLKKAHFKNWSLIYAFRSLIQKASTYMTVIITFTLSTVILTLLPHLKESIQNEIRPQTSSQLPQLFLFDIQKDQKDQIEKMAADQLASKVQFIPLVRSRILKLNDQDFSRLESDSNLTTREQEEEMRFRNRGVNLTYATELKPSESLTDGKWDGKTYAGEGLAQISLETKYADRIKAKIGDVMTFDVQGLEIKGKVTSLRSVRWTSFSPNFFILFQPGVLEEAPQNFLTSINTKNDFQKFQSDIVSNFGNVSIVDVRSTVQEVLVFVNQMSLALQVMAFISMILGLIVLMVITMTQINEQLDEFNLLKVLGAQVAPIVKTVQTQFLIVTVFSLVFGAVIGLGLAYLLTRVIFNISFSPDYESIFFLFISVTGTVFTLIFVLTRPLKYLTPMQLIRG